MDELVEAARGAVFDALEAAHSGNGAPVYDYVAQDQAAPLVAIDDIEWEDEGGKDEIVLRISITLITLDQGASRGELLRLMRISGDALHEVALTAAGVVLHPGRIVSGAVSGSLDNGVTRVGAQTFELYAEPA